jgi:single-stranded-DNA-specific exonuclease
VTQHKKRWLIPPALTAAADASLGAYPPVLRQILFNRGYATAAEANSFLNADPPSNTDPFLLRDMQVAVDRIRRALSAREQLAIYGDYDVDGVTATALLLQALRLLGGQVQAYIPHRFDEGYGLNTEALDSLMADGVGLVITVDCGIRSPAEALHAKKLGLDLIITDHHHPAAGALPEAQAVINPKQAGDLYPDKDLAGVGIAYKLAQALLQDGGPSKPDLGDLLDLVALGTVADLAPLVGENRHLVRRGLRQIRETTRQGLFALATIAEIPIRKTNARHIGFTLGPRLNAAGRLESAQAALELLTTTDTMRAGQLAQQLDVQNRNRQALTRTMQAQAEALALAEDPDAYLLFAAHAEFNAGVVGLAASRLSETYYRPAIVGSVGPQETRASCRSIPEFHITDALDDCSDLLVRHGGHAAAAGFTVRNENRAELIFRLKALAAEKLGGRDLRPTVLADAEVSLTMVRPELIQTLSALEPTGYGNPDPAFVARAVRVKRSRTVGSEGRHLKLVLEDERGFAHDGIGFRLGQLQAELPAMVDVLFSYEINEFNGRLGYQLNVKDLKPAGLDD